MSEELTFITLFYLANGFFQDLTMRFVVAVALSLYISRLGYHKKSLSFTGAVAAVFVGFLTTLASYAYFLCLLTFFVTSSYFTTWNSKRKKKLEQDFSEGGQRTAKQVLCNGGLTIVISLVYLLEVGPSERPIDFENDYVASVLTLALIGSLSCCNGDTWSSEIGLAIGPETPRLLTSFKKVPAGTNGAVSFSGLVASAAGGLVIGLAFYVTHWIFLNPNIFITKYPSQWPVLLISLLAGFFGSLTDSFLGACFQYSGYCTKEKKIVSKPSETVVHISGCICLDNHMVNFCSTLLVSILTPAFSYYYWNWILSMRNLCSFARVLL